MNTNERTNEKKKRTNKLIILNNNETTNKVLNFETKSPKFPIITFTI